MALPDIGSNLLFGVIGGRGWDRVFRELRSKNNSSVLSGLKNSNGVRSDVSSDFHQQTIGYRMSEVLL